jgi:hypothetical protein
MMSFNGKVIIVGICTIIAYLITYCYFNAQSEAWGLMIGLFSGYLMGAVLK